MVRSVVGIFFRLFTWLLSRARKIRCDSTRPICHNCVRRSNECQYDAAPKRRGPDKRPGTRQRSCKKRPADGSAPPSVPPKRKRVGSRNDDVQVAREPRGIATAPALRSDGDRIRLQPSLSPGAEFSSSMHPRAASDDAYPVRLRRCPARQLVLTCLLMPASIRQVPHLVNHPHAV